MTEAAHGGQEGSGFPGTGFAQCSSWELNSGPLQEQSVPALSRLSSPVTYFYEIINFEIYFLKWDIL